MRHSNEEKARSRERILEVAATRIRESGTGGPGVAEIMQAAGMTHGGFYKHFASRDDLVLAAVEKALADNTATMHEVVDGAQDPMAAFVDWYVSAEHVADPGGGCAVVALAGDVPRADPRVRAAYRAQVARYLDGLTALVGTRERANVVLSTLVGAVTIARALDEPVLAEDVLRSVRAALRA